MKVCHFIASKGLGRGEAYIELVNCLCETIDIALVVPAGALFIPRLDSRIQVLEYYSKDSRKNPFLYLEIYRLIKQINPHIVHTHFAKATEVFSRLNHFLKIPHVATKHNPRKGKIFNRLKNVIAVSDAVKASISHSKVTVINNGISAEPVNSQGTNDVFTICAVGRLDKIKGFDRLIEAVAQLDFDFHLMIAGEGEERGALERQIEDLGLQNRVELLGFREDIPQLLASSDLQVMSSLSEGFSLAMIEAFFYSRVFVSTPVSGCREILSEELLTSHGLAEKIDDVFNEYESYLERFSSIKEKATSDFSIETCSQRHIGYYKNLIGRKC